MRMPSGDLSSITRVFLEHEPYVVLGCISSEDRCSAVPLALINGQCRHALLLEVLDPPGAFPDRSAESLVRTKRNEQVLKDAGLKFFSPEMPLLASEDDLLEVIESLEGSGERTVVLDITSFPKRYFCFFVKRLSASAKWRNVVVTYTDAGQYPRGHLAEDPMTSDYLPGFAAGLSGGGTRLVVAAGFESLGIRSIVEQYAKAPREMKVILSFPPDGPYMKRQWQTLFQIASGNASRLSLSNIRSVSTWDAEEVYFVLNAWFEELGDLVLAPSGAKPHTLGMALFASCHDCAMVYTQPKSYNPSYAMGQGRTWAYVIKWGGIRCYERPLTMP